MAQRIKKQSKKKSAFGPGKGKTWYDKVNDPSKQHQVKKLDKDFADMPAGCKMLIAAPKNVDTYLRQIPKGKSVSLLTMRKDLATEYQAEYTCPRLRRGIFLRIVAEAAYEQFKKGTPVHKVAPFWRMVEENSTMNKKLSFGSEFVKKQRKKEGIAIPPISKKATH